MSKKETTAEKMKKAVDEKNQQQKFKTMELQGIRTKWVDEYKNDKGKVVSKWHWDFRKNESGPYLVEELDFDGINYEYDK
jgi:hypothetical protein